MKRLFFGIILALVLFASVVYAAEEQFKSVTLTAENVDCRKCHTESPHVIHEEKMKQKLVTCEKCHGDITKPTIPKCTQCHQGPIHQVHIKKVKVVDCKYCHKTIQKEHNDEILGRVLCAHCHRDLVDVHEGCDKCHKTAPDIVKPVKLAQATIICQTCHAPNNVVDIHGEAKNTSTCYKCHIPQVTPQGGQVEADNIPHLIHLPDKATCNQCHMKEGKVIIPQCSNCHDLIGIHLIAKLPQQWNKFKCSRCHPTGQGIAEAATPPPATPTATQPPAIATPTKPVTETPTKVPTAEKTPSQGLPGFEISILVASLMTVAYLLRKHKFN
ncbi:MAG TPA: hypothetical protein EYP22_00465 [Methanosarcinales archaeon]|nr:hypothetical protein [Methanosarcinales archaeon]